MRNIYIFLFVLIFFSACKKDKFSSPAGTLYFSGSVINFSNGLPVENALVTLHRFNNYDRTPLIQYDYATSDANGNYELVVTGNDKQYYFINASKQHYAFVDTTFNHYHLEGNYISSKTSFNDQLLLDRASFIYVTIHDTLSSSMNDTISYALSYSSDSSVVSLGFVRDTISSFGASITLTDSVSYKQHRYARIYFEVTNNGSIAFEDTTVLLNEFATKAVDFFY